MSVDLSLYLVTDSRLAASAGHTVVDVVQAAASNGITAVQVREKNASAAVFLETVLRIAEVLPEQVALFVNDRIDVFLAARAAGARVTGVHVGQTDLGIDAVREMVGPEPVIGLSAATEGQLLSAAASGARIGYIGMGTVHATSTKKDAPPPLGYAGFARLVSASHVPVVAIGGVRAADLPRLRALGAAGAAVVSAVCSVPDPGAGARTLRAAWEARG